MRFRQVTQLYTSLKETANSNAERIGIRKREEWTTLSPQHMNSFDGSYANARLLNCQRVNEQRIESLNDVEHLYSLVDTIFEPSLFRGR